MTDFTIIEARPWHCGAMARKLRTVHMAAVAKIGISSHRELSARFGASSFRRVWMINGRMAALGGVTGTMLDPEGHVWLAFTDEATRYPLQMIKEARCKIALITEIKPKLYTSVLRDDEPSKRFAVFLGFVPMDGAGGAKASSKYGRREMLRRIDGEAAMMVYEREAS